MTKLGFCSISALDRPLAAAAELAAGCGLDGVEITARAPHLDPDAGGEAARAAGRDVRAAGLEVIAYGSYLGRPGRAEISCARREAEVAAALGTPLWRVWAEPLAKPGSPDPEGGAFRAAVDLLRAACDAAAHHGITVVVERHAGSLADTPERIHRLLSAVERANLALNYQVLDLLPPERAGEQARDAADLVKHARYFHLKNYRPNPDGRGPLLPGGSLEGGVLDYAAILGAALDAGYGGPLTFEFLSFEPLSTEEKLAADVAFVRRVLAGRRSA